METSLGTNKEEIIKSGYSKEAKEEEPKGTSLIPFDPLQRYLAEIRRYPLLTREEERKLAIKYREENDLEAAYILITANLRLVVKIALEFQRYWMMNLLDIIQEGNIGLMQAVKKFDPYRGVKLSYYASFWIKAYILKFIMDNWRLVKIGTTQAQRRLFFNLSKERERLESLGYDVGPKLLAEKLDTKEEEIIEMEQRMGSWDVSLESPVRDDSDSTHMDLLSSGDVSQEEVLAESQTQDIFLEKLEEFRETLRGKELYIFEKRLLSDSPLTLQQIGDEYGLSKERVRQIEKRLMEKIRNFFKKEIPDFDEYDFRFGE
ncbi:MAG: RNA polymerase factor sigma-32 [Thermodesulfobacteriota bacterium]